MHSASRVARKAGLAFVLMLLPAVIAFWVILSGALARAARADAVRSFAAIMNQADRLANDLDLELSFLDALFSRDLKDDASLRETADRASAALAAYRAAARWPSFVRSVYAVEAAAGDFYGTVLKDGVTRVLRVERFRTEGAASAERVRALVAVLDEESLAGAVVPELAAEYFGSDSGFGDYTVWLRDGEGRVRYSTAGADDPSADFSRPLLRDAGRFDVTRFYLSLSSGADESARASDGPSGSAPGAAAPAPPPPGDSAGLALGDAPPIDRYRFLSTGDGGWTLEVGRRGVSIPVAARREAFLWSAAAGAFLALLYGSVLALYLSSRRTAELASRERAFVASVTHELKTPIAVALSAGENLGKGIVAPERVAAYGDTVAREARRLADSVERLLTVAGLESAQPFRRGEPVPLKEAVDSVTAMLAPSAAARGASFAVEMDGSPIADGSRALVESAIECVLGNAVKYAGGEVRVRLSEGKVRGRRVALLSCADSGPGIPRGERARVFEPFWRGKAALDAGVQGTGVGLYLARRVARVHGGDASLRCPPEGGTVVELSFRSYV